MIDFKETDFAKCLLAEDLENLEKNCKVLYLKNRQTLFDENKNSHPNLFFILLEGELVVKKAFDANETDKLTFLNILKPGSIIGEMILFGYNKREATVISENTSKVLAIPCKAIKDSKIISTKSYSNILEYISKCEVNRVKNMNQRVLKDTSELQKASKFIVSILALLSLYAVSSKILESYLNQKQSSETTLINFSYFLMLVPPILYLIFSLKIKTNYIGINLENLKNAIKPILILGPSITLFMIAIKLFIIHFTTLNLQDTNIFSHPLPASKHGILAVFAILCSYIVFSFFQEAIARGVFQNIIEDLLLHTNPQKENNPIKGKKIKQKIALQSNIYANLVFASMHTHISISFVCLTMLSGLFFGATYQKTQKNIAVVTFAHALGGYLLAPLGFNFILR